MKEYTIKKIIPSDSGGQIAPPIISIVIPVKDEEESLALLYEKISAVASGNLANSEILFINDGSEDGTQKVIERLQKKDSRVRGIELRRNFGQTAAMSAGFDLARGGIIITMDADLQNDPADIPRLLSKIEEGYDVVSGWRKDRKDKLITRRIPSVLANRLIGALTGVRLHDYGCTLKAYRREALEGLHLYGDMHRFLPAFASIGGFKVGEIEVNHHERKFGRSKYGLGRIFKVIFDLLVIQFLIRFLTKPIRFFGGLSVLFLGSGLVIGSYLSYIKIFRGEEIANRPLLLLSVSLILAGIQIVILGILGEVLSRIYFESQNKKTYVIRRIVG